MTGNLLPRPTDSAAIGENVPPELHTFRFSQECVSITVCATAVGYAVPHGLKCCHTVPDYKVRVT